MDWCDEYRDQGFITVDNVLPYALIDAHLLEVSVLLRRHGVTCSRTLSSLSPTHEDALMSTMLELHRRAATTRQLVFHRGIRAILRQLFGAEPRLRMARSALWEPGDMRAHVDTAFRSPEPPYSICRTWCALEDIHPSSGSFYLVPGTHRTLTPHLCREVLDERPDLEALSRQVANDPGSWFRLHGRGWSYVSAKVADRIEPKAKTSFDLRKGDVIIFNPAVAHGTLPCTNSSLTRKMMVCEWSVEDEPGFDARRSYSPECRIEVDYLQNNLIDITAILAERAAPR